MADRAGHDFDTLAAIDLGSNSFHMVIARVVDGELQVVDRIKDMVRLAAGLRDDNYLEPESQQRALSALERLGDRLSGMPLGSVRAVGTNTLRKAQNSRNFLREAESALGHPIEIISGSEEARLIYLGVSHTIGPQAGNRLVMDIGGGSTEFIVGRKFEPILRESKYMGCVSYSNRFFPDGKITRLGYRKAMIAARQELTPSVQAFRKLGWDLSVGSSGTIKAVHRIILENGFGRSITYPAMKELRRATVDVGDANSLVMKGLPPQRAAVIAGGLAILMGAFKSLKIEEMTVSDGALREGVLYDLMGRISDHDIRDETISSLAAHNQVDESHAQSVESTALRLLDQVETEWGLKKTMARRFLSWAAQIHEIGLSISHSRYHIHGSYLVENSDLPGFSRQDQNLLWALVRSHRRSFKLHRFADIHEPYDVIGTKIAALLRLAVLLNRNRRSDAVPKALKVKVRSKSPNVIRLSFPPGWLDDSPLTQADLNEEVVHLSPTFQLKFE